MNQLWMPSLSICKSLSELDDIQLKIAKRSAENLLENAKTSVEEMHEMEPMYQLNYRGEFITDWYKNYKTFIKAYLGFAKEEMQYRFGKGTIVRSNVKIPAVYHTCYHVNKKLLWCAQPFNNLTNGLTPINFITREVLCKHWKEMKTSPIWTRRKRPDWYCESRGVLEMLGKMYQGDMAFIYNQDGSISPEKIPQMKYKKIANGKIEFVTVEMRK